MGNVSMTDAQIMYPKIIQSTMMNEELATRFAVVTKKHHALYDFMTLTLSDEDKLDNIDSLETMIKQRYHRSF
jgi:hypothetical protein